ncbi:MAG: glycosyltransferase family 4 protein [Planctomycetes bacterium]|nr:glycosyltransferase family 4 protein [Planctomycetota bacterium]
MHILQVANVGRVTGGTGACAWTIAHSLSACRHTIAFLSRLDDETRGAFAGSRVLQWKRVTAAAVRRLNPDVIILHNTPAASMDERLPAFTLQYAHSRIDPAAADVCVYCSRWLAERYGGNMHDVLYQPVPRPPRIAGWHDERPLRERLVIGRLCTPTPRKWPDELVPFYRMLAGRFRDVQWEFVGCPPALQPRLQEACGGRATFHTAGWNARGHLWRWDALLYHHPHVTESFGRVAAEAMRAGCIPIVDGRGGFLEQIVPGCGFRCGSPPDFAAAIAAITDPADRWPISRTARAHADERFSPAAFREALLERLSAMLGRFQPRRGDGS